ncbi:MAG: pre-peptidase C-terminal domain-containing protein [Spirochaetales bacterium]|nr:pre-peptidase C-terminal domain-containing protein [Spirochaetales bacterium]
MKSRIGCFAIFAVLTFGPGLYADDYGVTIPEDVSLAIDKVVKLVIDTVPHSASEPALVAVRSIELEDGVPPFGELFSFTVSTRITTAAEPGLEVRAHLPAYSYLYGSTQMDSRNVSEGDFSAQADYVLIGESFETTGMLHLLFQIIDVKKETIISGLEHSLLVDQWLFDLLGADDYSEDDVYVESDRFEPDSVDSPLEISIDETITDRTIGPPGDTDWYVLRSDGAGEKMIIDVYTTGETDTYIEVYGPDDPTVLIEENDDGIDANARVRLLMGQGQTVWVSVRGYDDTTGGYYSLHTESASFDGDPNEPDGSMEEATRLVLGAEPVSSYILPSTDEDWYYIDIAEIPGENVILSVQTAGDLDTYLDLYDGDGIELFSNDDGGDGENARIDMFLEKPGRFYARVIHYDGTEQGEYQILADFTSATPDQYEPDDSRTGARSIDFGMPQERNFTPSDDQDWVTFELAETSTVTIATYGDVDTFLKLFDRVGNMIAEDDDSGNDYNASIERMLQRGKYYVRVNQVEIDSFFGAEYRLEIEKR